MNALASLNKERKPFFLGDKSIWSFRSVSSLSDYSSFEGPGQHFSLAIISFGTFEFIVPKCAYRLGKWKLRSLDSLT